MLPLLIGIALLVLLIGAGRGFVKLDPRRLAQQIRLGGGWAALLIGAALTLIGRVGIGLPLIAMGVSLLGLGRMPSLGARLRSTPGRVSQVRSAMLEMQLDHDSGTLSGRVLAGRHAGRELDELPPGDLLDLASELAAADPDGLALAEAYLDRRLPGWREHAQRDAHPRGRRAAEEGAMTEEEAYQILGLEPAAGAEEIRRAHRSLMKKLHPDQGGSTYLAARVNAAKERLLERHR